MWEAPAGIGLGELAPRIPKLLRTRSGMAGVNLNQLMDEGRRDHLPGNAVLNGIPVELGPV